jgi:CheY-like chemotaxis protein
MKLSFPILLVDDDTTVYDVIQRTFTQYFPEANLMSVSSYKQALAYLNGLEGYGPKLILLDLDLQTGPTGFDLLSLIRLHPLGKLIPVIVLTSNDSDDDIGRAYSLGANAYNLKPFGYEEWKAYIKSIRAYWFNSARVPKLYFDEADQISR